LGQFLAQARSFVTILFGFEAVLGGGDAADGIENLGDSNKGLSRYLSPLDATLTENGGTQIPLMKPF